MKIVISIVLFVFPLAGHAGVLDFLFPDPVRVWDCAYRDNGATFTLKRLDEQIVIDGKYKVFYRKTVETPPLGDFIAIYTNKGYTYDLLYDDGMLFVGVKPNNQSRRVAWCETYTEE